MVDQWHVTHCKPTGCDPVFSLLSQAELDSLLGGETFMRKGLSRLVPNLWQRSADFCVLSCECRTLRNVWSIPPSQPKFSENVSVFFSACCLCFQVGGMILVVQNSKELDEQRTLFLESMSLCVSIVKPRTSSHQTIAEALDELQVSPRSSSTQIILLQKRTRFNSSDLQIWVQRRLRVWGKRSEHVHFENFCSASLKRVLSTVNSYS